MFLTEILSECRKNPEIGYPFRTGGLPSIYTTTRIMEQALMALDLMHQAGEYGYLHGDTHMGNLYFSDFRPQEGIAGEIGFGCLLDLGSAKEFYPVKTAVTKPENQVLMNALGYYYFLESQYEKSKMFYEKAMNRAYKYEYWNVFVQASIGLARVIETSRSGIDEAITIMERFE